MITYYTLTAGEVVETQDRAAPVLLVIDPTPEEKAMLISQYQLDEHNLNSTQDPFELPRLELEDNHLAVIFKEPKRYSARDNFVFLINAVGLFLYQDRLIVVASSDFAGFKGRTFLKVHTIQTLFLRVLSSCVTHFIGHLQVINDIATSLEAKLMTSMENRNLLLMFSIEKSLVYYINAISANGRVIERLKLNARNNHTGGLTPEMLEYVDDLAIENAQCLEQSQVYANVFTGLMDARASVVSNNLNALMKRLTVINVVFVPLNVLAGICGMSEFTMMTQGIPWPIAYSVFILGLTIIGVSLYKILRWHEDKTLRDGSKWTQ